MSDDLPPQLDPQLLDDYFSEADEHLSGVRHQLLNFEESVGKPEPDMAVVGALFEHFHSFKGISALVGLKPAESLAHAAEDYLRLMRDRRSRLTSTGLEALMQTIQRLEQIVKAFSSHEPLPRPDQALELLRKECGMVSPQAVKSSPSAESSAHASEAAGSLEQTAESARARGQLLWRYAFSPNKELNSRGININSVREQLSLIGEILQANSRVEGKDSIIFDFIVASAEAPSDIAELERNGLRVEQLETERQSNGTASTASGNQSAGHSPFLAPSHIVRVDLQRLDDLMRITGEMVIERSRLDTQLTRLKRSAGNLDLTAVQEVHAGFGRSLRELREAIMRVRLISVAEIFARMPFVVRDLAHQTGKKVRLNLYGQQTVIDKYLVENLKDPLLHLVRNAISHGIETPKEREAAQKDPEAVLELSASTSGDSVIIGVSDDGRGIQLEEVAQRARELGMDVPEPLDQDALLRIISSAGFSTRAEADLTSGRGVGMSVVSSTIRRLGGNITVTSQQGMGTKFTIHLPLTLSITEALIVQSAGQICAVPQRYLREILLAQNSDIQKVNGIHVIPYRNGMVPVLRLSELFHLPEAGSGKLYVLIVMSERGSVGLLVEEIIGQREIVVRALNDPLLQVFGVSGATELGDGKPVLILDGNALTSGPVRPSAPDVAIRETTPRMESAL